MRRSGNETREGVGRAVAAMRLVRRHERSQWSCRTLVASALLLASASMGGQKLEASLNTALEYEVKAAFMFRFAQFVEWPADTFKEAGEPFRYCTIGDDPFHGALERTLNGKTIGQRALRVEHLTEAGRIGVGQVLFGGGAGGQETHRGNPSEHGHFADFDSGRG